MDGGGGVLLWAECFSLGSTRVMCQCGGLGTVCGLIIDTVGSGSSTIVLDFFSGHV